jgi:hypothetical protein
MILASRGGAGLKGSLPAGAAEPGSSADTAVKPRGWLPSAITCSSENAGSLTDGAVKRGARRK